MKIFNVEGRFMDAVGERSKTQDMTFNNTPILELKDLPTTVEIFRIREAHFRNPEEIPSGLKKRKDASLQMAPSQLPNHHLLSYVMYSQSAYRYGDYVAKCALFPTGKLQKSLEKTEIEDNSDPEQHSMWLREYFKEHEATYDLRVQLCQDIKAQPVEDASTEWNETAFPFQTVAKIMFPKGQDSFSPSRRTFWEDNVSLNVWYGLEDHRPFGSVNRLRRRLYGASQQYRTETNVWDIAHVDSVDQIP